MTRLLIATGKKYPEHKTVHVQFASSDENWHPQLSPGEDQIDWDEKRKQEIEEYLVIKD
jgi:methionyl-tRNA formyltransferase